MRQRKDSESLFPPSLIGPSESDYAASSLIAYIGNKRALLPFLKKVFLELHELFPVSRFLDPFAGTGSVSRLARTLGWQVTANDIEPYSLAVNSCWLGVSADDVEGLFPNEGGVRRVLNRLNTLHPQRENIADLHSPTPPYMARHYAPEHTASADWRRERLFYTQENAVFLDRVRQAIEELRPASPSMLSLSGPTTREEKERVLLLGPLIYEAATHANTSGVFKAFHKGFGGHGRDALGRILAPMYLEAPVLWPGPPAELGCVDAAVFCGSRSADLCYLDPPYNQHQYGSNYHILNTLTIWNRPPVDDARAPDGSLRAKAGIPPEWKERRSPYCSRKGASTAFAELLGSVDARFIVLSYNSEGLVPPDELYDMLAERSDVSLRSVGYTTYRGGRQSAARRNGNSEILFVAERREGHGISQFRITQGSAASSTSVKDAAEHDERDLRDFRRRRHGIDDRDRELGRLAAETRLTRALSGPFDPRLLALIADENGKIRVESTAGNSALSTYRGLLIEEDGLSLLASLDVDEMNALADRLEPAMARDNADACEFCARLIEGGARERRIQDLALAWLRKLAHRKYAERFRELCSRLALSAEKEPGKMERLRAGLVELQRLFAARMAGQSRSFPFVEDSDREDQSK
jgi:adenine-specific DNA-methyltransferase